MWKDICTDDQLHLFLNRFRFFHDSCLKELKYQSGAYVNSDLSMYPINNCRTLSVIIQRQDAEIPMVELQFEGLKYLNLFPVDESFTCEILASTMFFKDGLVYWCDHRDFPEIKLEQLEGIVVCASGLRWRVIDNHMGATDFYHSLV